MSGACRSILVVFGLLWLLALGLFLVGAFGLFGAERDPLSAVFLIPLGLPWIYLIDHLPEMLWPWAAALAPGVNLAILVTLCRLFSRPRP
ncbi:MAG: hypothetical protein EP307_05310 [Rhodobacteraceae bacterium]|nr:MAG: hypothetical protein EP307_05310 [Paracoccaceae bacterium]